MTVPRIVIAGTHSGCGKTTVATGLMGALAARGLKVQPFKAGPDFIDPTHHTAICGRPSRNLDPFMMGENGVQKTFERACTGADIAIVEGVMGLYDGLEGGDTSSTAHVARLLSAPVLLVVDVKGSSRSANAMIKGYREFDRSVDVAGAIFNRVGSPNHRRMIEASLETVALGWIPKERELEVESRHLGLRMAHEAETTRPSGRIIEKYLDIDGIVAMAGDAKPLATGEPTQPEARPDERVTIGVARDAAFCFYYRDNLDALIAGGARLEYFSPIEGRLPPVDGLYLGGGYPELYARELESSRCREDVKKAVDDGMPVYAECGGLMYLCEDVAVDKKYRMAGILPACTEMTGKIQALGYVKGESVAGGIFAAGTCVAGHEFHYSRIECAPDARFAFRLSRGKGIRGGRDGLCEHNAVGGYTHAYFSPGFAGSMIKAAEAYERK